MKITALASTLTLASSLAPAQSASGLPEAREQEVTLGGARGSDKSFDDTTLSVQGSSGKYLDSSSVWGLRQTIHVGDSDESNAIFNGATRVFYDYHFDTGPARPFTGANPGGFYGRDVRNAFVAGPELGIQQWLESNAFVSAMAQYPFLFHSGSDGRDRYEDGALLYSVNLGYNF